ncbi:unnamed protein product [Pleuronectes platessa]|uniref:Uncharacterized protein n=1 Tax=Pleuronectes platessa TaxID=8262 RepID=A0A9N7V093_PLEPL|nr:unnamed protein product [Pleuronectes platessa]
MAGSSSTVAGGLYKPREACALNCGLQSGCKVVSSTRLLLFTLSRLPAPPRHSVSSQFKEAGEREEGGFTGVL